ncbi:DUF962 domain-containing protein [Legionella waltersii]|uniref:Transmembrane protein n=1 Tax=Legionella waltersii TaxID=66969 RepID=A0A0W1A581_9GAMM|nr:Mpo1-like protein [Legionella waltersii]KTD76513.1 transmembrane protein [Legionella waltersii]SNU93864.1 transmembrane protein [Legionella waltersii]
MKPFIAQAQLYASFHQNPVTRYTHFAGVPLIILSIMILLGFVKIVIPGVLATSLAFLVTIALLVYYFMLTWELALPLTPILLFLLWLSSWFSHEGPTKLGIWSFVITFVVGWGLQFYGHFIEGKKPAFLVNITQMLIAPLYLTAELFFMAGYMSAMKEQIYQTPENEDTNEPIKKKGSKIND